MQVTATSWNFVSSFGTMEACLVIIWELLTQQKYGMHSLFSVYLFLHDTTFFCVLMFVFSRNDHNVL